ncbi:MAG: DUF2089 domain-containing protein [Chloroflexi bacterium]|nr:DUF2089 domain-containing protein [Chloroflexota bacterium]
MRELQCAACGLELRGRFEPAPSNPFARLTPDQQAFLRLFVMSRGNLSDVERTLGVSYPTVRAKLEDLIRAVGTAIAPPPLPTPSIPPTSPLPPTPPAAPAQQAQPEEPAAPPAGSSSGAGSRKEVLARIAAGELTAEQGLTLLRQTGR